LPLAEWPAARPVAWPADASPAVLKWGGRNARSSSPRTQLATAPPGQREELRALQAPLKDRYSHEPESALITLSATGTLGLPGRRSGYSRSGGSSNDALMCSDSAVAAARCAANCC